MIEMMYTWLANTLDCSLLSSKSENCDGAKGSTTSTSSPEPSCVSG